MGKRSNMAPKPGFKVKPKMKLKTKIIIVSAISLILIGIGTILFFNIADIRDAFGATRSSTQAGAWNNSATWGGASPPTIADIVTINHAVTITSDCSVGKITINSGGSLNGDGTAHIFTLEGTSGNDFIVHGSFNANGTTLKLSRNNQLDGTGEFNFYKIDLNSMTLTLKNTCTSVINLNGAPDPFINPGGLTPGNTSTICYNGTSPQNISNTGAIKFNNLFINNSSGVTLQKNLTGNNLKGDLNVLNGTLYNNGFSITGNNSNTITVANEATLYVSGTVTAFSAFASSVLGATSTVEYSGTTQTISPGNYGKLIISGTSTKTLNDNTTANQLILTSGYLALNDKTLTINNSDPASLLNESGSIISENTNNSGKIQWNIGTAVGVYTYPFSTTSGTPIPFSFEVTNAGIGAGNITVSTYPTPANNLPFPTGVTNIDSKGIDNSANTVNRFWQIDANSYTTKPTSTMTFTASATEVGLISNLKAQRWNGTSWDEPLPDQISAANSVTVKNVSNFSPWTLTGNNTPLPIKLIAFNAMEEDESINISWITSTEINNDYFTVERSVNGAEYTKVTTLKGAGNSTSNKSYKVNDNNPLQGTAYYRLKQTDFDGKYTYSPTLTVTSKKNNFTEELKVNNVAPNPFHDNFVLNYTSKDDKKIQIELYNLKGELEHKEEIETNTGSNQYKFHDNNELAPGIYILFLTSAGQKISAGKIVKEN